MSSRERTRGFVLDNALSLVFGLLFLGSLVGQALAGWSQFNDVQQAEGLGEIALTSYLTSPDFAVDVVENWQSEYLQFLVYIMLTVWLVQKGSTESKKPGEEGPEPDEQQKLGWHAVPDSPKWAKAGGWRTMALSWSLMMVMSAIFVTSWTAQLIAGWAAFNETRLQNLQDTLTIRSYALNPDLGEPHESTGAEG